jgi:hypothetical protein
MHQDRKFRMQPKGSSLHPKSQALFRLEILKSGEGQ